MRRKDREVTDIGEIREILEGCKTCHVAMCDQGTPYVVPLSYGFTLEDNTLTLYFHSAHQGRKIDILQRDSRVCFCISCEGQCTFPENACNSGYYFSSVIGNGEVLFMEEVAEKCAALTAMFAQQSGERVSFTGKEAAGVCVYKLISRDFSAKRKRLPS